MSRAAIFLDRDGTLNVDTGYISRIEQFHFIKGVIAACAELQQIGYTLVVITNQSGIARGYFSEADFLALSRWMQTTLAAQGVNLAGLYYCPHHPEWGQAPYRQYCDCRKPRPGLLFKAQHTLNLDLARSYMVGDSVCDLQAAAAAGVGTKVLVRSGQPITAAVAAQADWVLDSLVDLPAAIAAR